MTRRGYTMIEMLLSMSMLGLVLDIGISVTGSLVRLAHEAGQPAQRVDLACDALRRDLGAGGHIQGQDLFAGKIRWHVAAGTLTRDGVPRLEVVDAIWQQVGREIIVRIRPVGFAQREVCAWP